MQKYFFDRLNDGGEGLACLWQHWVGKENASLPLKI
jgi:hypothetical protein